MSVVEMTEFFAGAGGTSQGAAVVPGLRQVLAANHSRVAMSTHAANFPEVEHDVADLSQVTPRRYRRTEILWASPECTWQTGAAGRPRDDRPQSTLFDTHPGDTAAARRDRATREVAERSRATMFDVLRFAEHHRYDAILVENVVEAATLWLLWRSWLLGLHDLGYETRVVCANSMHFPGVRAGRAPQSRDRLYVVAWRRGAPAPRLELRPAAWCEKCGVEVGAMQSWKRLDRARLGRYRQQYVYRCPHVACRHSIVEPYVVAGAAAIDWTLPGVRIAEQRPRFVPNTMRRIKLGCDRIDGPFIAELRGGSSTARSVRQPLATIATSGNHHRLVQPDPGGRLAECRTRMLVPVELQAAMGFRPGYTVLGTDEQRKLQIGNAVTPCASEFLLGAVVDAIAAQSGAAA
jgi:DNA (cytosine-5)-methyltransferase 1